MGGNLTAGLIGAGLGAGGAALLGGKDSGQSSADQALRALIGQQTGTANNLLGETALTRRLVLAPIESTLLGLRPTQLPVFAPARDALEQQFTRARQNVIANAPVRGGQLNRSLVDLEGQRAQAVAGVESDLAKTLYQTGAQIGFQVPGVALGGMGSAAQSLANLSQQATQRETGKGAGIGGLFGNVLMASALKK